MERLRYKDLASIFAQRYRIVVWILIGCGLLCAGIYGYYFYTTKSLERNFQQWLMQNVRERGTRINAELHKQLQHDTDLIKNEAVITYFEKIQNGDGANRAKMSEFFRENSVNENYNTRLLINRDGQVIFAPDNSPYNGVKIMDNLTANSALGEAFVCVLMSLTHVISEYEYDPILKTPTLFLCLPVFKEGNLLGVMASIVPASSIANIMHEYIGLGKTGDIVFTNMLDDGIRFISKSRIEHTKAFKNFYSKQQVMTKKKEPFVLATTGHQGAGLVRQNDIDTISAWSFIQKVNWGVAARKDVSEVIQPYTFLFILATLLFVLCIGLVAYEFYIYLKLRTTLLRMLEQPDFLRRILKVGWFLLSLFLLWKVIWFVKEFRAGVNTIKYSMKQVIDNANDELNRKIHKFESVGFAIAHDVTTGYLHKEDLIDRLKREIKEQPFVHGIVVAWEPYSYDPQKKLHAPYVYKKGNDFVVQELGDVYDYTSEVVKDSQEESSQWAWYSKTIKQKNALWFTPYLDAESNHMLVAYSIPFFKQVEGEQQPLGVVNVVIDLKGIKDLLESLEIGRTGYPVLFAAQGGYFIYHPNNRYVVERYTLYDLAEEEGNEGLLQIGKDILSDTTAFHSYKDSNGETILVYSHSSLTNGWNVNGVVSASEGAMQRIIIRQYCITLLIIFMIWMFCGLTILYREILTKIMVLSHVLTAILALSMIGILLLIRLTPSFDLGENIILDQQSHINRFLQEHNLYAQKINEPTVIAIPTGIEIFAIEFPTSYSIKLSGYLWQKFGKGLDPSMIRDVFFEGIQITQFQKLYETKQNDEVVVGWQFNVVVAQKYKYSRYPFDSIVMQLSLEYPDLSKPFLLIPALVDYRTLRPESLPGLLPGFNLSGFSIHKTYFAFSNYTNEVTLGLSVLENVPNTPYLSYNIMMLRDLLSDFVIFFLPIMIIFFLLYAIYTIQMRQRISGLTALGAYTGLIFAVTFMHRSLRERFAIGDILYIEYLFFLLYIVFGVLSIYTLLGSTVEGRLKTAFVMYRIFFWPIQLFLFFIITIFVFYSPVS